MLEEFSKLFNVRREIANGFTRTWVGMLSYLDHEPVHKEGQLRCGFWVLNGWGCMAVHLDATQPGRPKCRLMHRMNTAQELEWDQWTAEIEARALSIASAQPHRGAVSAGRL